MLNKEILHNSTYSKQDYLKFKGFGLYQIIGGSIGIYSIYVGIMTAKSWTETQIFLSIIAIGLYSYSIYSGNLLLERKTNGFRHTLINQVLQLINFIVLSFYFEYIAGIGLSFGIRFNPVYSWGVNIEFSTFQIGSRADSKIFDLSFNVVAVYIIYSINELRKKVHLSHENIVTLNTDETSPST